MTCVLDPTCRRWNGTCVVPEFLSVISYCAIRKHVFYETGEDFEVGILCLIFFTIFEVGNGT